MNAVMVETPKEAARRLAAKPINEGFKPEGMHAYRNAEGEPLFWRIRLKHPNGEKWMRPMRWTGDGYALGEPAAPPEGRVVYRLPELLADAAATVWIVEGEACADALAARGAVATTSGSCSSADGADWAPLAGRSVRVWPDNDAAGAKYADAVIEHLHAFGCVVERVDVAALNLPDKGDCVDWLKLHPDGNIAALPVLRVEEKPKPAGFAPEPLRRPLPPAAKYPMEALGDVLGGAAQAIHRVVKAPAGLCGQSVLAAASLAVQAHADVLVDGRREPLALWHVTVGSSGERKSGADKWALHAHRECERKDADAYWQAMAAHEIDLAAYGAASRSSQSGGGKNKKTIEEIREAMRALGAPPEPPLAPWLLLPEATLEGLHKLFQTGRPSLGLFNDDAGDFLDGHAMNRENRTKSAAGFSKLWDSGEFSRIRAGDGAAKFYGRRLAMHVMVQPVIAERVLSDDVLNGQGFLPRCLIAWPDSTVGTRVYNDGDLSGDPALNRYWSIMNDLLTTAAPLREGSRNELAPRMLTLTGEAKAYWVGVHDAIEADMKGEYANVQAWASKAAANALRIAGVLTLVEKPDANVIGLDAINRAAQLAGYYLREAVRVIGTASVPARVRNAEALLAWCRETGRALLYSTAALNGGPNAIRTNDAFSEAVDVLEAAGWISHIEGGMEVDGAHRRRVWRVIATGPE